MPRYLYVCECGWNGYEAFPMLAIATTVECVKCNGRAERKFQTPHLITQPTHLRDEWRPDHNDSVAARKEQDKSYLNSWNKPSQEQVDKEGAAKEALAKTYAN